MGSGVGFDQGDINDINDSLKTQMSEVNNYFQTLNSQIQSADQWLGSSADAYKEKFQNVAKQMEDADASVQNATSLISKATGRQVSDQERAKQAAESNLPDKL